MFCNILLSHINNKMACDFPFQGIASQWFDTMLFLTTNTNTVYWIFLDSDIIRKSTTKSETPYQGQAPSHAD